MQQIWHFTISNIFCGEKYVLKLSQIHFAFCLPDVRSIKREARKRECRSDGKCITTTTIQSDRWWWSGLLWQGHHELSGKSDENKSFKPNQSAHSIYIKIELCHSSLDQWEIKIHLIWGKCFNIPHCSRSLSTNIAMRDSSTLQSFLNPRQERAWFG